MLLSFSSVSAVSPPFPSLRGARSFVLAQYFLSASAIVSQLLSGILSSSAPSIPEKMSRNAFSEYSGGYTLLGSQRISVIPSVLSVSVSRLPSFPRHFLVFLHLCQFRFRSNSKSVRERDREKIFRVVFSEGDLFRTKKQGSWPQKRDPQAQKIKRKTGKKRWHDLGKAPQTDSKPDI